MSGKAKQDSSGESACPGGRALGVGMIVVGREKVLLGLRRGVHGGGTWSVPGGDVESGESPEAAVRRELHEETGLEGVNARASLAFPGAIAAAALPAGPEPARGGLSIMSARPPDASAEHGAAETGASMGIVEAIHIAPDAGEAVCPLETVRAIVGVGLEGDRYALGRGHYQDTRVSRDLTLIEAEAVEAVAAEHGLRLSVGEARRNITTRGIGLNDLVGRTFWVGEVLCRGTGLCEPCQYLVDLTGKPLLRALVHRGGLRAEILRGGFIRRGDVLRAADGARDLRG